MKVAQTIAWLVVGARSKFALVWNGEWMGQYIREPWLSGNRELWLSGNTLAF